MQNETLHLNKDKLKITIFGVCFGTLLCGIFVYVRIKYIS